jgi:hypothetical protein
VRHNWCDEQLDLTPAATLKFGYKSSSEKGRYGRLWASTRQACSMIVPWAIGSQLLENVF